VAWFVEIADAERRLLDRTMGRGRSRSISRSCWTEQEAVERLSQALDVGRQCSRGSCRERHADAFGLKTKPQVGGIVGM